MAKPLRIEFAGALYQLASRGDQQGKGGAGVLSCHVR